VLEAATRTIVSPFVLVGGIRVASVDDIMATKLAVVAKRGELRDYFDIMKIEQDRLIMAETGLAFVVEKFSPVQSDQYILSIVKALGYLDDVEDDSALPVSRKVVVDYWITG
jgi:predicted nucleotidyltransferase component of viral defense system